VHVEVAGTSASILARNFLNSTARCRRCTAEITVGDVERGEQAGDVMPHLARLLP